jgi:hypothetical protein
MEQYYYSPATGQTYSAYQLEALFGINTETTAVSTINRRGFYPVVATSPDFDTKLYNPTFTWTFVPVTGGQGAERTYTANAKPLPEAKENASIELKQRADSETQQIVTLSYLSNEVLTSVASQDPASRSPFLQDTLDQMDAVSVALGDNLAAVDAATSVDEINNIVNKPTGTLFTGRGAGLGPEDLNVSYYTEFNSVSLTEAETELYVPSTDTVIAYGSGGPGQFDSFGNAFNLGGPYTMQIRESATGMVIAEIEVPLNASGENVAF